MLSRKRKTNKKSTIYLSLSPEATAKEVLVDLDGAPSLSSRAQVVAGGSTSQGSNRTLDNSNI